MSLLLDALKRAAEQKAAKDREDESGAADAPDTVLDARESPPHGDAAEDGSIPRHQLEDETELDPSELDSRLERLRGSLKDGTETRLEAPRADDSTFLPPGGRQSGTEDETFIFAEDDAAEVMSDDPPGSPRGVEDETELSQLLRKENEASAYEPVEADPVDREDTELRLQGSGNVDAGPDAATGERAAVEYHSSAGEDTDLRQPESASDGEDANPQPQRGEETDLSLPAGDSDPLGVGGHSNAAEETDLGAGSYREDDTGADEDMSLLLVEREPTQLTDPQRPQDALRALQAEAPTAEDLGLVDITQRRPGQDAASDADTTRKRGQDGDRTLTRNRSDTATTGIATATANLHNVPRPDPGATHTHAPDNYDRTLMRLPNDDASRLFAGMKSDAGVVMTPDYAKRVFQSKSSALRFQNLKVYSGIAIAILLGVGIYGILEYQAESDTIDANLMPLKNDPYPGTIPSANGNSQAEPVIAEGEVDERAFEILQRAENRGGSAIDATPETEPEDAADGDLAAVSGEATAEAAADEKSRPSTGKSVAGAAATPRQPTAAAGDPVIPAPIAASEPEPSVVLSGSVGNASAAEVRVAAVAKSRPAAENTSNTSSSRLQIQTSERLERKQVLLSEAYDAYRSGDDVLALQRYNQVLAIDPGNRNALLARAAIHLQNGDSASAIEDYQTLLLANPKDSLAMASLLAVANISPLDTETRLKLMIRDEPDSAHLNFALANAYARQNRWKEAQGHYFTAFQNNPKDPNYAYNLAVSLEHISQPRAAVSYYRRALENYNKGLATFSREAVDRRLEKLAKS